MNKRQVTDLKDRSIVIYSNGLSHVRASANIKAAEDGSALVTLQGFPLEALVETFHSEDPSIQIASAQLKMPHTYYDLLASLVGREVDDLRSTQKVTVKAVVSDAKAGTPIFLVTNQGEDSTYLLHIGVAGCNFSSEQVATKHSLDATIIGLSVSATPMYETPCTTDFSYLTNGIQANVYYTLTLTQKGLVVQGAAKFENRTGKDYVNLAVTLVPGKTTRASLLSDDGSNGRAGASSIRRLASSNGVSEYVDEGQLHYTVNNVTIPKGISTHQLFATAEPIPFSIVNKVDLSPRNTPVVVATLDFNAPALLPKGSVAVYSSTSAADGVRSVYEGGGAISQSALEAELISIPLKTPDTLKVEVKRLDTVYEKLTDSEVYVKKTNYEVCFTNGGTTQTTLDASLQLGELQTLEATLEPTRQQEKTYVWKVDLNAGEKSTFKYTLNEQLYKPLSTDEVKVLTGK